MADSDGNSLGQGLLIFSGDPYSATPAAAALKVPRSGRGYCWVHVKIAAHGSDTTTVAISGRLNANGGYVALKKADESTAASIAQSAGALTEVIFSCQLMPDMKVVLSGTSTSGASAKVWVESLGAATRSNS